MGSPLIFTDDLKMKAIKLLYGPVNSVVTAFKAGNDVLIFRFNNQEEKKALDKVAKLVSSGRIKESRINKSVKRINKLKEKYNILDDSPCESIDIDSFNAEVSKVRELCGL